MIISKIKRRILRILLTLVFFFVSIVSPASPVFAQEQCQSGIINSSLNLTSMNTSYNPSDPRAPAGVYTITGTWKNITTGDSFFDVFAQVKELTGGNVLLNADGNPGGVGSRVTIGDLGEDGILSVGEEMTQSFEIGLQRRMPFRFFVDTLGTKGAPAQCQPQCEITVINDSITQVDLVSSYDPSDNRAPAGVFTITATWRNASTEDSFFDVFAKVIELTGENIVLNADGGPGGVGSQVTFNLGDDISWAPGEEITQVFEIGLTTNSQFDFNVDLMGIKGIPGSCVAANE